MNVTHHTLDGKTAVNAAEGGVKVQQSVEELFSWLIRIGIVVISILGFAYLIMLNSLATLGFDLESLKQEGLVLKKSVESWDIELAIPSSLYALESTEQIQNMANIKRRTFFEVAEGEVAMIRTVDLIQ